MAIIPVTMENFEEVLAFFKEHYSIHSQDNTRPYDDIMELLETLNNKGIKCAIVSNKFDGAVQELKEKYDHFEGKATFHQIGTLQTNKVKYLIGKTTLIHSVDSYKLAKCVIDKLTCLLFCKWIIYIITSLS